MISKEEYNRLANDGFNIIPLIKDLNIELDSPISLYSSIKDKKKILSYWSQLKAVKNGHNIQS